MAGIPTSNILQPGAVSIVGGATQGLISTLQLLKPEVYNKYGQKYGTEDFTWWLSTFGGMEKTINREFEWWENRGKLMTAITTASGATSTAGSTITLTLSAGDHYNSGTETPLRVGETLRTAIGNVEFEILTIPVTTAYAFEFTARPKQAVTVTISSGDILLFGGDMDAGEASDSIEPLIHTDIKYTNTTTEMRDSWSATDLSEMTTVWYDSGVTGDEMAGGGQAGTSYFTYKGLVKTNTRFKNYVEAKLMRGDTVTNTGLNSTNSVGTQGFIPKILEDGETIGYTPGTLDIAKMHEITRVMDVNGCAMQNLWLQDIYQRQNFSDGIFKEFPAGAFVWGEKAASEEAAIAYGAKSLDIDGYRLEVKKYPLFNTEYSTGKTPTTDRFRNFGIISPLSGETRDAKDATKSYKNIQVMVQPPVGGGTVGNGIRVWQHGGASLNPTSGKMEDKVEMICYRGIRVCLANQFIVVQSA